MSLFVVFLPFVAVVVYLNSFFLVILRLFVVVKFGGLIVFWVFLRFFNCSVVFLRLSWFIQVILCLCQVLSRLFAAQFGSFVSFL